MVVGQVPLSGGPHWCQGLVTQVDEAPAFAGVEEFPGVVAHHRDELAWGLGLAYPHHRGAHEALVLVDQPAEELLHGLVFVQGGGGRAGGDHPGLERLDVGPRDRGRVGGGVGGVRVGGVLGEVAAELGGGEEVVVAGGLRVVPGPQGPVPVAQVPGPGPGQPGGQLVEIEEWHGNLPESTGPTAAC